MHSSKKFITHEYHLQQIEGYVKSVFYISEDIYVDMIMKSMNLSSDFLFRSDPHENERYLIYRFIRSILRETNDKLICFKNDREYKTFCIDNNLSYGEFEWFKVIFINDNYENAESYILRNSLSFQSSYFPEDLPCVNPFPNLRDCIAKQLEFKSDFQESLKILKENNITKLYHFTDRSNLNFIIENGGLYSYRTLIEKGITVNRFASDESSRTKDKNAGLDDFVRLSFTNSHPMMHYAISAGRIKTTAIIEIDPTILLLPNSLFCNMNALKVGVNIGSTKEDLSKIRFDIVKARNHFKLSQEEKPYYQAEILVKRKVGAEMFLNLKEL